MTFLYVSSVQLENTVRVSLLVQQLRTHLAMQGTLVPPLVWEDLTRDKDLTGQTEPALWSPGAATAKPT